MLSCVSGHIVNYEFNDDSISIDILSIQMADLTRKTGVGTSIRAMI